MRGTNLGSTPRGKKRAEKTRVRRSCRTESTSEASRRGNVQIAASAHSSSISEGLVINGNIESRGNLHLKGQVQGDIRCQSLFVDEGAQIHGNVMAEEVVIQGSVVGAVRASGVVLQAKSHLEGEVWCQNLTVEQGAIFEGVSRVDRERSVPPA